MFRFPSRKASFEVLNVYHKLQSNYVKLECRALIPSHAGPRKCQAANTMFFAGFGSVPKRKTYFMRVCHSRKVAVLQEVSVLFYLQPFFESLDEEGKGALSTGIQFMKIENKEELEHRKRNINYLLKIHNKEEFIKMKYATEDEDVPMEGLLAYEAPAHPKVQEDREEEQNRAKKIIFRARVVNLGELEKVNRSKNLRNILRETTIHFRGRFLLRNRYYEERLQVVRKKIVDEIAKEGVFSLEKALEIPEEHLFLLEELCNKGEKAYALKGYCEDLGLEDEVLEIESASRKISDILGELKIASAEKLVSLSGLSKSEVVSVLSIGPFTKLSNGCYIQSPTETGPLEPKVLKMFARHHSVRKADLVRAMKEQCGNRVSMEQLLEVMNTFCERKGSTWILKTPK